MSPLAIFLALSSWSALAEPEPKTTALSADLDGDGIADRVTFYQAHDATRGFLQVASTHGTLATTPRTSPIYPAWKALAGRLDGAREDRVVLGVWTHKNTRPGDSPRKSIWVVGFDGLRFRELWRGSALARPFDDFALRDLDGDGQSELVVRECADREMQGFTAYRWSGFGFAGLARLRHPCDADAGIWTRLRLSGGNKLWLDD